MPFFLSGDSIANPSALVASYQETRSEILIAKDLFTIEQRLEKIDAETLVLFDVDSTLIVPDDAILRPSNDPLLETLLGGETTQKLPTGLRYVFREILLKAPHSRVEDRSVAFIQKLQEKGIPVIAFTAAPRGKVGEVESVAKWRLEELKRFGFDFSAAFAEKGAFELTQSPDREFAPLFQSGVLFASLHPKGDVLREFLQTIGWKPKQIVLIDDQLEYVENVGRAVKDLNIDFIGFHYTAAAHLPFELNQEVAEWQIRHFFEQGEWKSDSEARQTLSLQTVPSAVSFDKPY